MKQSPEQDHWSEAEEGIGLLEDGEIDAAVRSLEAVIERNPTNEYALFFLGNAHFEEGRWEKALKAYVSALEQAPDYAGAMIGAGHALRMLKRSTEAIRMGQEVLRRRENDPDALYLLGTTHFHRGDESEARTYLQQYLATRPEVEVDLEVRGMLEALGAAPSTADDEMLN